MQWLSLAVGSAFLVLVVVDVFWTVLWSAMGAGPLSSVLTGAMRTVMRALAGRRRLFSATGPLALAAIALAWATLLLIGFTLVLQAMPEGIRAAATGEPADALERGYYAGFTIFTLGMGDFVPHGTGAQAVTVLMNAAGMFLITLSVTYLVPVIGSSVQSRSVATSVRALGATPDEILVNGWDGRRINLDSHLRELATQLAELSHKHLAYPVLHLFHSSDEETSAPRAVMLVEDTINLLQVVRPDVAPPVPVRRQLRAAVGQYLETFGPNVHEADHEPPPPTADPLVGAGIPLRDDVSLDDVLRNDASRRRRAKTILDDSEVSPPTSPEGGSG